MEDNDKKKSDSEEPPGVLGEIFKLIKWIDNYGRKNSLYILVVLLTLGSYYGFHELKQLHESQVNMYKDVIDSMEKKHENEMKLQNLRNKINDLENKWKLIRVIYRLEEFKAVFKELAPHDPSEGHLAYYGNRGSANIKIIENDNTLFQFKLNENGSFAGIIFVWQNINNFRCFGLDTKNYNSIVINYKKFDYLLIDPMVKIKDASVFTTESNRRYLSEQSCNKEQEFCEFVINLNDAEQEGLDVSCLESISIGVDSYKTKIGKKVDFQVNKFYFK